MATSPRNIVPSNSVVGTSWLMSPRSPRQFGTLGFGHIYFSVLLKFRAERSWNVCGTTIHWSSPVGS